MSAPNKPLLMIFAVLAVFAVALAAYFVKPEGTEYGAEQSSVQAGTEVESEITAANQNADETQQTADLSIDVQAALEERILGDTSAPLKISEHSSFTCGHCGQFHQNTFQQFKENFIDTGKAYLVFSDFPLNAPAMHASMAARCLPEQDRYFEFVDLLFKEQDKWAYETNYLSYLKEKAAGFGLAGERFDACIGSKDLQDGLLQKVRAAQAQWNINSTPSFVLNNTRTISGAMSYEELSKLLEEELSKGSAADDAPEETESAAGDETTESTDTNAGAPEAE